MTHRSAVQVALKQTINSTTYQFLIMNIVITLIFKLILQNIFLESRHYANGLNIINVHFNIHIAGN